MRSAMATERLKTVFSHLGQKSYHASFHHVSAAAISQKSPDFKYTLDNPKLTREQRQFYEENGFVVIRNLVSPEKLDRYRERFAQICRREVAVPGMIVMRDVAIKNAEFVPGEQAITKVQDFQDEEVLFEYCNLPEIVDYVECFTGPEVAAIHTMLINKPPDAGKLTSRHPMHQDLHYFPLRPANRIVCSWTAMQTINRQNGCLVVVPGTHKGNLLRHEYPKWEGGVNKMYHGIQDYDPSQYRVHLEMEVGDTVFFHPLLIHGSGTNRSDGFRKSISCHYADSRLFDNMMIEPEQEIIAKEVNEIIKKRLGSGAEVTFMDVWRYKSRPVRGQVQIF